VFRAVIRGNDGLRVYFRGGVFRAVIRAATFEQLPN